MCETTLNTADNQTAILFREFSKIFFPNIHVNILIYSLIFSGRKYLCAVCLKTHYYYFLVTNSFVCLERLNFNIVPPLSKRWYFGRIGKNDKLKIDYSLSGYDKNVISIVELKIYIIYC
jgi:hypothetical protein